MSRDGFRADAMLQHARSAPIAVPARFAMRTIISPRSSAQVILSVQARTLQPLTRAWWSRNRVRSRPIFSSAHFVGIQKEPHRTIPWFSKTLVIVNARHQGVLLQAETMVQWLGSCRMPWEIKRLKRFEECNERPPGKRWETVS